VSATLLKMYLKYAMEKRKASVETVDEEGNTEK
jgi:hypothetical protein